MLQIDVLRALENAYWARYLILADAARVVCALVSMAKRAGTRASLSYLQRAATTGTVRETICASYVPIYRRRRYLEIAHRLCCRHETE